MYSFAQKKFALIPFVVLAVFPVAVLNGIYTASKTQSPNQLSKVSIVRVGNSRSLINKQTKPSPADLEVVKGFSFPFEITKADSAIDCQAPVKGRFYTKC